MSKISIIIPTYNSEKYIGRCIRSLLDQSIDQSMYDIIVINDGSIDKTLNELELFKDDIILIDNKKNIGLPSSLNIGIRQSKSKFVVRVDSDDYVNKKFLEFLYIFLISNKDFKASSCDYYLVDEKENIIERKNFQKNPIGCAIMFYRDALIDLGLYDEYFLVHEDKDLMKRYLKKNKIINCQLPLYRYRRHENNITNRKDLMNHYEKKLDKN